MAVSDIQALSDQLTAFHDEIPCLLRRSNWIMDMVSCVPRIYSLAANHCKLGKILDFRNNEAMQNHETALRQIASESHTESENMVHLAKQTARDSKLLKALTILATMYLPSSLLAVSMPTTNHKYPH